MTDAPEATADTTQSRAVAVRAPREVRVVDDIAPLFDTARFEHYGRIAAVMATATLIPDALKGSSREETVGNCFMVVSMADRLGGFDPWAVAQCCSIIAGKLMLEGKLVHAAIKRKLGLDLHTHYTGQKGADDFRVYMCDEPFTEEMIAALRPGMGLEDMGYRVVDGSVGEWKTFEKGGQTVKGNWLRQPDIQLFYRGTRVWQRRFEPEIMLGVYTDDEMDALEVRAERRTTRGTASKLTNGGGDKQQVDPSTLAAATEAAGAEARPEPVQDAEFTDAKSGAEETAETATGGDEAATGTDAALPTSAALQARAEELAKIAPGDEDAGDILGRLEGAAIFGQPVCNGHAEEDEVYLLAGLEPNEAGKWLTFKNGTRFSTKANVEGLKVYAIHAPEPPADDEDGLDQPCEACGAKAGENCAPNCPDRLEAEEAERLAGRPTPEPTATDGVQPAESEPATSETATPASDAGAGQAAGSGPSTPAAAETTAPASAEGGGFLASLRPMTSWLQIKPAWIAMNRTSDWLSASPQDQDEARRAAWAEVERVKKDHGDPVDHASDLTAFGIWMATQKGRDGADAVEGTLNTLKRDPNVWPKLGEKIQATVEERVAKFLKAQGDERARDHHVGAHGASHARRPEDADAADREAATRDAWEQAAVDQLQRRGSGVVFRP